MKEFISLFNQIGRYHDRNRVFRDFITVSAISISNSLHQDERLEKEYLDIIHSYNDDDQKQFSKLFALLIQLLEVEPTDALGQIYMDLGLGDKRMGQIFTPSLVSELMAKTTFDQKLEEMKNGFITLSEPACGAGGMILAYVKIMISRNLNPAKKLWVQAIDIDRTAALMCYVQLSLWNVPAQVVVGNTLTLETREVFYTPAHILYGWSMKINQREAEAKALNFLTESDSHLTSKSLSEGL